jgi:hypothetical protein
MAVCEPVLILRKYIPAATGVPLPSLKAHTIVAFPFTSIRASYTFRKDKVTTVHSTVMGHEVKRSILTQQDEACPEHVEGFG